LGAIGFTIWAHCASKFEDLKGTAGFTDKIDITAVYYVCYIVFGVIGGTALIGIIACCCCQKCCMTLYAILLIIFSIVGIVLFICWCAFFGVVIANLKDNLYGLLEGYVNEYDTGADSITINVLQILFGACGVEGFDDYEDIHLAPKWIPEQKNPNRDDLLTINKIDYNMKWPLTCCTSVKDMVDMVDQFKDKEFDEKSLEKLVNDNQKQMEECKDNPTDKGIHEVLHKLLCIIMSVGIVLFLLINILIIVLICKACSVLRNGPKDDKYGKKYNERASNTNDKASKTKEKQSIKPSNP